MTKVYDATNAASFTPTYSFTGFASGDTSATLSNTTLQYATSGNVATSHVVGSDRVLANGLAVTGITGSNGSLATDYSVNGTANSGRGEREHHGGGADREPDQHGRDQGL